MTSIERFEVSGADDYSFVSADAVGERAPGVFTSAPADLRSGDIVIDQVGLTAQMLIALGPDQYEPDKDVTLTPLQAPIGDSTVQDQNGIQVWQPGTEYNYPDIVITGAAATGYMLWIATGHVDPAVGEPGTEPSAWVSLGGNTAGLRILGSVPTPGDLPTTGNTVGDLYYCVSDGSLYSWGSDNAWHNVGYIVGPSGPPGADGAQGPTGPQGPQGEPGEQGPQGSGIDVSGSVPTSADLPTTAPPGTALVVEDTGNLAIMGDDGSWYEVDAIVGPVGPQGAEGATGPPGPVTPMEIVEGLDVPVTLPDGALFFDLDALGPVEDHDERIAALEVAVDDHETRITTLEAGGGTGGGGGVTDHGALTGLLDDDHTQYHTDARGDARYAQFAFKTITVPAASDVVADGPADTLSIAGGSGVIITTNPTADQIIISAPADNGFGTVVVAGQSTVAADQPNDALTLVAGTGVALTTDPATDTVTIASTVTASGITVGGDLTGTAANAQIGAGVVGTPELAGNAVDNTKLADMATARLKGRVTAATGDPEDLTGTQVTTLLDPFTSALKGVAPASGGGTTNYLRADGTWAVPTGSAGANAFGNVAVSGQTTVAADAAADTLTLAGGTGVALTTDAATDTVTITNSAPNTPAFSSIEATGVIGAIDATTITDVLTFQAGAGITIGLSTVAKQVQIASLPSGIALGGDLTGSAANAQIAAGAVGTPELAGNAVDNTKLADMAAARFKGRVTASTGDPEDMTGTQATTLLDAFTSALKGLAPASGGGTTNFLRADGTWSAPPAPTAQNTFDKIAVAGQTTVAADAAADTLTLAAGPNVTITTDAATDTVTIAAASGGAAAELTGVVKMFGGAAAPAGYLLCDGASYLRATYPDLFTALGGASSPWGLADSTHFNVPDMRGRAPVGVGTGTGLTARALAGTGGEESHTLSAAESGVPAHGHAVTNGTVPLSNHSHTLSDLGGAAIAASTSSTAVPMRTASVANWTATRQATGGAVGGSNTTANSLNVALIGTTDANTQTQAVSVQNNAAAAAASAHNVMQPYVGLTFIIKT